MFATTESAHTWTDVALTAIAALPGVIAAVSSLRNGRTLKQNGKASDERTRKRVKKKTSCADSAANGGGGCPFCDDWYKPPDFK